MEGVGADQKIASFVENKCVLGHPKARATSYCLFPDKIMTTCLKKMPLTLGSVKFTVTAFHCEESTHRK